MAVSFLDGKYVKQMTTSLEEINSALNALNDTFNSSGDYGATDLTNNIILDRNIISQLIWSSDPDQLNKINSNIFDIKTSKNYVIFMPNVTLDDFTISTSIFDTDNNKVFSETFSPADINNITVISGTNLGPKMQLSILSGNFGVDPNNYISSLFMAEVTSNRNLTEVEKAYIREKIGAGDDDSDEPIGIVRYDIDQTTGDGSISAAQQQQARANIGLGDINSLVTGTVKYSEPQSLNDDQKSRARENIGAASAEVVSGITETLSGWDELQETVGNISTAVSGAIRYDINQTTGDNALTTEQQQQARANIGLSDINNLVTGTVKYSGPQALQPGDKSQARENIGAASASDVSDILLAIAGMEKNVTNITKSSDGKSLIVEYADNTVSDPITVAAGQTIGSIYYDDEYMLHILDENGEDIVDPITIYGGGGGTVIETGTAEITPITTTPISYIYRQPSPIRFSFRAVDVDDEPVGNGRGTWTVDGVTVASNITIRQGVNEFDISNYLNAGENTVRLSVAVNIGGSTDRIVRKTWTVNAVDMRFTWNYNDAQINTSSFTDNCVVYGGVLKTIHTIIDEGTENEIVLDTIQTTRSNATQLIEIPMLSHGAHGVKRWLTATIGSNEETTPVQYHEMVFVEDNNTTPIIAVSKTNIAISQYDTVRIPIYVYDPASLTADVDLYIDNVKAGSWANKDRTVDYWTYSPTGVGNGSILEYDTEEDDSGAQVQIPSKWQNVLKIVCGEVEKEVPITVNRLKLNANEVPGYDFKFKASEFINNDDAINWSHTTSDNKIVTVSFSDNFDWVNGGLHTETVDDELNETNGDGSIQQYFSVKAGTTMTINFNPFKSKDVKETGMTFKIIFKVKNCRKYNAEFAKCYDESNNTGIRLFAHNASFSSIGQTINMQYDEDQYTELEFDVYPSDSVGDPHYPRYIMGWLDGVMSTCRVYEATDIFRQDNNSGIIIGSQDCDVNVYLVKTYSFLIDNKSNFDNHISNFIMDAPNGQQMLKRFNRNDILDDNGDISYAKLADRNPDLRIWLYDIPYMTNKKSDKVPVSFEQIWKNGSNYYQMHGTGKMSVQGTSSVGYIRGAANTDINFTSLYDGNNNDLLANGTQDDRFGNNWYYEDPENVGHAKEFSVLDAKIDAGVRKVYTPQQAMSIAKVNDVSLLGNEWVVYKTDTNDVPILYINTNDSDDPEKTLGAEWVAIERDSSEKRNPTKYIKALGMKLNDDSCPITYSNTKVNFASCEQVNNMCNAAWYQMHSPYPRWTARDCMEFNMGVQFIKDAAQGDSSHFALFDNTTKYNMYSIANMGTSKKNVHIFHDLSNPLEVCIEVKDNTEAQMRMISSDMSLQDWTGDNNDGKKSYYEMRYPDTSNPDALNPNITSSWYSFVEWMASSNPYAATNEAITTETYEPYTFSSTYHDRPGTPVLAGLTISRYAGTYNTDSFERRMAKMLSQCEQHMVMDSFVYHYVYLTRHTMVDNVSKNNFWSSSDLEHWDLSKAYDMDTSDGNDNQGKLVFDYGLEFDDVRQGSTAMVFNGSDSVWFRFVANLPEACERMFQRKEVEGAWSASEYHKFLTNEQHKVPERCWNQTYWYDYLRTHEDKSLNAQEIRSWILYLDGGQKIHQRQHYEKFQELFMSTKYRGSVSTSQEMTLYAYAPAEWGGIVIGSSGAQLRQSTSISSSLITNIPRDSKVTVLGTTTADNGVVWKRVRYGNYTGYAQASQVDSIDPKGEITLTMYNKMYIYINNGTTALQPVKVGGDTPYTFTFNSGVLSNAIISVYTSSMITKLTGVEQLYCTTINLGSASRLREVSVGSSLKGYYNANLTSVVFSANRMLERIDAQNLPNISAPLSLIACPSLEYLDTTGSGFTNYEFAVGGNLKTAILQAPVTLSMKNLYQLTNLTILDYSHIIGLIIENCPGIADIDIINNAIALTYIRLIGIYWELTNSDLLNRLYGLDGYNENNVTTDQSILAGYVHPSVISKRQLKNFTAVWPNLNIDVTNSEQIDELVVRFVDSDGTALLDRNGNEYVQYIVRGEDAYDPIAAGELEAPSNKETEQYIYTFSGWDNIPTEVIFDTTVTAVYEQEAQVYTVSWYNDTIENADTLLKSVTATYGEEVLYDPENENNYPVRTDMEHLGVYRVFKGWDNSTGFIRGNTKVHAIFESGSISTNTMSKKISQLSVAEIYAIAKSGNAASSWTSRLDYTDIKVGRDFNFGNVNSQVLLENKFFNGDTITANRDVVRFSDLKLFSADASSFTLVIDYEFADITSSAVLASCISTDGVNGFKLEYSDNGARIVWGDQIVNISKGNSRGIVALRHRKGSKSLYIYADNNGERGYYQTNYSGKSETDTNSSGSRLICYNKNNISEERARAQSSDIDSILSFGAVASMNGVDMNTVAKGWIHFAKIWDDDLGNTAAQQLAYWPHETWRMHYSGSGIYNQVGSGANTNASFMANAALPQLYKYYKETDDSYNIYNDGGWTDSALREFINDKCYKALPVDWLSMLQKVYVRTVRPNDTQNSTPLTTEDYMTIPARIDVINVTDSQYIPEGRTASWFDEYAYNRAKFAGIIVPNNAKHFTNSSSDPTSLENASVTEGDIWVSDNVAYVYVSQDTASKHYIIGGREVSNSANKAALGDQGGMWIRAYAYWLRTPAQNRTYQYQVDANGDVNTTWLSPYSNMRAIVLQFSI